jgi:hypothetical protein
MSEQQKWWHWHNLRLIFLQGIVITAILIGVLLLLVTINRVYGDYPPVSVVSLDPRNLGEVCPGDEIPFHNQIKIDSPTVVLYDLSTMDVDRVYNYFGTGTRYGGLNHPEAPVTFKQTIEWTVPYLPPGKYARVFSARGHETEEKPVFAWSYYTIGEKCNERLSSSWRTMGGFTHFARNIPPGLYALD